MRRLPLIVLNNQDVEVAFHIKTWKGPGTSFVHQDERGFFFVSAGHLFEGVKPSEKVHLHRADQTWMEFEVLDLVHHPGGADVCCFALNISVDMPDRWKPDAEPAAFPGDEFKFVGFPHGLEGNYPGSHGFATGLVRTAFFSGVIEIDGVQVTLLDGLNNPGYSGSPVYGLTKDGTNFLCAVVTGFRNEREALGQLYRRDGDKIVEVEGHFIQRLNSGLIYAAGIAQISETAAVLGSRLTR